MTAPDRAVSRGDPWVLTARSTLVALAAGLLFAVAPVTSGVVIAGTLLLAVMGLPRAPHATALALVLLYSNAPVIVADRLGVPTTLVAMVVPGLLLLAVVLATIVERRPAAAPRPLAWLLVYAATLATATVLAPLTGSAIDEMFGFLTEGLLLYILIVNAIRDRHTLKVALWAVAITASLLAALSLHQAVTQSYDVEYFGFAQHSIEDVDSFLADTEGTPARAGGPIGMKNRYAQFLLMVLPIPLIVALRHPIRRQRFAALVASVLCGGGVVLTISRGAVVAVVLTVLTMLLLRELRLRALLGVALVVVVVATALPQYGDRLANAAPILQGIEAADETDGAVRGRLSSNLGAMRVFLDHPLTGVGPGNYPRYHQDAVEDLGLRVFPDREVHNLYPQVAAESGLLGLLGFGGLLLVTLRELLRIRRRYAPESDMNIYATGVFLGLLAYLYAAIFLHMAFARYFWMLMGLAAAVVAVGDEPWAQEHRQSPEEVEF